MVGFWPTFLLCEINARSYTGKVWAKDLLGVGTIFGRIDDKKDHRTSAPESWFSISQNNILRREENGAKPITNNG